MSSGICRFCEYPVSTRASLSMVRLYVLFNAMRVLVPTSVEKLARPPHNTLERPNSPSKRSTSSALPSGAGNASARRKPRRFSCEYEYVPESR